MTPRAAVFIDRDGTLLDELGYRGSVRGMRLLHGAAAALRRLNQAGLPAILVTNQSGVARGLFDEADLTRVHAALEALLATQGARLDGIFYCPHLPPEELGPIPASAGSSPVARTLQRHRRTCSCRKPAPGLLHQAARALDLDLAPSWMVGDSLRDLAAGRRAGLARRILVATGKGESEARRPQASRELPFEQVPDFPGAVERILAQRAQTNPRA